MAFKIFCLHCTKKKDDKYISGWSEHQTEAAFILKIILQRT